MEFERTNESPTFNAFDTAMLAYLGNAVLSHKARLRSEAHQQKGSALESVRVQLYSGLNTISNGI